MEDPVLWEGNASRHAVDDNGVQMHLNMHWSLEKGLFLSFGRHMKQVRTWTGEVGGELQDSFPVVSRFKEVPL